MSRLEDIKKKRHADEWHGILNDIDWLVEKLEKAKEALRRYKDISVFTEYSPDEPIPVAKECLEEIRED